MNVLISIDRIKNSISEKLNKESEVSGQFIFISTPASTQSRFWQHIAKNSAKSSSNNTIALIACSQLP